MAEGVSMVYSKNLLPQLLAGLTGAAARGSFQWGQKVIAEAQAHCPVLSGELRDSGYCEQNGNTVTMGFRAPYALYVEEGHHTRSGSWVPPQAFFVPAIQSNQRTFGSIIGQAIMDLLV